MADEDGDYFLAPQDQRPFGAGIRRQRVEFVPASKTESVPESATTTPTNNLAEKYLAMVMEKRTEEAVMSQGGEQDAAICSICKQPVASTKSSSNHESTIAHQVCLEHSHPPSHLDRNHVGLRYLANYGFDPDDRLGLGANREGIRIPVKAKPKHDTVGLREALDEEDVTVKKKVQVKKEDKIVRLNAKEVRRQDAAARKRAEKLRSAFYGPDLEQYLGPNS